MRTDMTAIAVCQIYGGHFSYYQLMGRIRSGVIPAQKVGKSWMIDHKELPLVEREFGILAKSPASIAA